MKKIARYLIQPPRGDGQRPMHDPNEPIWNMSIEDLLVVPAEQIALAQKGPFVINLVSASTPARVPGVIPGFEQRRTYRLSQTEHGRPRYRVRMGFFDNREEAELALNKLRDKYPGAFVTNAREADLRYAPEDLAARARAQKKDAPAQPAAAAKPAPEAKPAPQAKRAPAAKEARSVAPPRAAAPVQAPAPKKPESKVTRPAAHRDADESDPDAITDIREQPDFSDLLGPEPELAPLPPATPKTKSGASQASEPAPKPAPVPVTEPAPRGVTRKNRLPGRYVTSGEPAARSHPPSAPTGPSESGRKVLEAVLGTAAKKPHKTSTNAKPTAPRTPDKRAAHGSKSHAAAPSSKTSPGTKPSTPSKPAPPAETTMEALALIAEAVLAFDDDHGIDDHLTVTQPAIPPAAAKIEPPAAKVEAPVAKVDTPVARVEPPAAKVEAPLVKAEPPAEAKVEAPVVQAEVTLPAPVQPVVAAPAEPIAPVAVATPEPAAVVEVSAPVEPVAAIVAEVPVVTEIVDVSTIAGVPEIADVPDAEIVEIEIASIPELGVEAAAVAPAPIVAVEPVVETRVEVPVVPMPEVPATLVAAVSVEATVASIEILAVDVPEIPLDLAAPVSAPPVAEDVHVAPAVTTGEVVEISIGLTPPTADTLTPDLAAGSAADESEFVEFTFTEADPIGRSIVDLVTVTPIPPASPPAAQAIVAVATPAPVAPAEVAPPPAPVAIESAPVAAAPETAPVSASAKVETTDDVPTWVRAARIESPRMDTPPVDPVRNEENVEEAAFLLELKAELAAIDPSPTQPAAASVSPPESPRNAPVLEKPAVEIALSLLEEAPLETRPVDLDLFHDERPMRDSRPSPGAPMARKTPPDRKPTVDRKPLIDRKPSNDRKPVVERKPAPVERKEMPKPVMAKPPVRQPEPVRPTPVRATPPVAPIAAPTTPKEEADIEKSIAVALKSIVRQSKPTLPADEPTPELDSTQTLRVLTDDELRDKAGAKWFAVQLACSEHPANLQLMPRLEIFAEYQLYSVAGTVDGKLRHMLRMGFFKEEIAAQTVTAYMKSFFDDPTVARVSAAEHERFSRRALAKAAPAPEAQPVAKPAPVAPPPAPTPKGVSFVETPKERRATDKKRADTSESAIRRMPESNSIWKRLFK